MHYMHTKSRGERGFTLIELLVVIAIIGILSAVVLASLNTARQKSRDARRTSDIKQVATALELYFSSKNTYPTVASGETNPTVAFKAMAATLVSEGLLQAVPVDPSAANAAANTYAYASNGTKYHIGATLESTAWNSGPLLSDADYSSKNPPSGTTAFVAGFEGLAGSCGGTVVTNADAATADKCYDLIP